MKLAFNIFAALLVASGASKEPVRQASNVQAVRPAALRGSVQELFEEQAASAARAPDVGTTEENKFRWCIGEKSLLTCFRSSSCCSGYCYMGECRKRCDRC